MDFLATPGLAPQPHVALRVEVDPGLVLSEIDISRDGRPLRSRAVLGGDSYEVLDHEAPFGRLTNYRADFTVRGGWVSVYRENWATAEGVWATAEGTPSVSGGRLVAVGESRAAVRSFAVPRPDLGRVVIDGYTGTAQGSSLVIGPVIVHLWGASVTVRHLRSDFVRVPYAGGNIEVTWSVTSARITTSEGSATVERGTDPWPASASAWAIPGGFVPGFEVFEADEASVSHHSLLATALLPESRIWLIHPTLSPLSIPIHGGGNDASRLIEKRTRLEVSHAAKIAEFMPAGRDVSVTYPLGPRSKPPWELSIFCADLAARDEVLSLLSDSAPSLLRVPEGHGNGLSDLPDGWYQVKEVDEVVSGSRSVHGSRMMGLKLTPCAEPPTSISTSATWASLFANGLKWSDLLGHSWYDVLVGVDGSDD